MSLVRFSVRNFRSFKSEQVLSLEAGRQGVGSAGRSFQTGFKSIPTLLKTAVIYGANSGGKSNLITAMSFLAEFVEQSARSGQINDMIDVQPYKLDPACADQPSEFEVIFIHEKSIYQYGFSATRERVISEWLYQTPQDGRLRHVFSRDYDEAASLYEWYINSRVRGEKKVWQESTRQNSLFLSVANQLNAADLLLPFEWITKFFRVFSSARNFGTGTTSKFCLDDGRKRKILGLVQTIDADIVDISISEKEIDVDTVLGHFSDEFRAEIMREFKGRKNYDAALVRRGADGSAVPFDLEEESTGNNILFGLAGPLIDTLDSGFTLVIDELDSGIHPLALRALVSLFFNKSYNQSDAQLVISCHEATLLQDNLLRTDQVWFVDRSISYGSELYPLSAFKPRQNESFLRGYLGGRYRGIPITKRS